MIRKLNGLYLKNPSWREWARVYLTCHPRHQCPTIYTSETHQKPKEKPRPTLASLVLWCWWCRLRQWLRQCIVGVSPRWKGGKGVFLRLCCGCCGLQRQTVAHSLWRFLKLLFRFIASLFESRFRWDLWEAASRWRRGVPETESEPAKPSVSCRLCRLCPVMSSRWNRYGKEGKEEDVQEMRASSFLKC